MSAFGEENNPLSGSRADDATFNGFDSVRSARIRLGNFAEFYIWVGVRSWRTATIQQNAGDRQECHFPGETVVWRQAGRGVKPGSRNRMEYFQNWFLFFEHNEMMISASNDFIQSLKTVPFSDCSLARTYYSRRGRQFLQSNFCEETLTPRELDVLQRIASGNRNREIAERLFISEETVKVHVKHIMEKLGANDRTQAVAIAVRRGIIQL